MSNRAESMLSYVPSYYQTSKFYLGQNNAKGAEFDIINYLMDTLPDQFFPSTCTWSLPLWEKLCGFQTNPSDSIDIRRARVAVKISTVTPITPNKLVHDVQNAFGMSITFSNAAEPYTILAKLESGESSIDIESVRDYIANLIPIHISLVMSILTKMRGTINVGSHLDEFIVENLDEGYSCLLSSEKMLVGNSLDDYVNEVINI